MAATPSVSISYGDEGPPPKELEVITADMETRLRATILRIIRPALDQLADFGARLDSLVAQVARHEKVTLEAEKQREVISQQAEFAKLLSDRVDELDYQLRKQERSTSASLTELRSSREGHEEILRNLQGELRKQARDLGRAWEETQRLQEQHDETLKKQMEGISGCNRKTERTREEVMELVRDLQTQHDALSEELFGEGKGLTKIVRDLAALTKFTQPIPEMDMRLKELAETAVVLKKGHQEVAEYCDQNSRDMEQYYNTMEQRLASLKEESKQEGNRLIAHHAALMKDIRRDYAEEIEAAKHLREEITRFQRSTDDFCHEIAASMQSESRRIDAIHREIVRDMDEIQKRRRKDRAGIEQEMKDTRVQVAMEKELSNEVRVSVEYLSRILGLVLEGERLSSAMLVQDFTDRSGELWLGLPSDLGKRPEPPQQASGLEQRPRDGALKGQVVSELVPVDWRKGLAKVGYLPGQVLYGGVEYERKDMLLLHHKLLQKAHEAFMRGPPVDEVAFSQQGAASAPQALATVGSPYVPRQPAANGGIASGQAPGSAAKAEVEEMKSEPSWLVAPARQAVTGRQRPGSQGQPEAVGSRGTMSGPLGDTAPRRKLGGSSAGSSLASGFGSDEGEDDGDGGRHAGAAAERRHRGRGGSRGTGDAGAPAPLRLPAIGGPASSRAVGAEPSATFKPLSAR